MKQKNGEMVKRFHVMRKSFSVGKNVITNVEIARNRYVTQLRKFLSCRIARGGFLQLFKYCHHLAERPRSFLNQCKKFNQNCETRCHFNNALVCNNSIFSI